MSPASAGIVETAARLARESLAPRAARYDHDAANPVDSWRDLHAENLIAGVVPVSHGGLGLDMPTYVDVIRVLVSLEVTSKAIQVVGGRGAYRDFPVERVFRDARTATLMPPTMDRMAEAIGKSALGLAEGMFRISGAPPGA